MTQPTDPSEPGAPIEVPAVVTPEWVAELQGRLDATTRQGVAGLKPVFTQRAARAILERAEALLKAEPTLIELNLTDPEATVTVVGDTHGQFHDVCKLFATAGCPGDQSYFIFNGDFVDRGAWGLETLALLLAWKLALPARVLLLRGNHESATCTMIYGFKEELKAKYGKGAWQDVYTRCKRVFASLPLAALVQRNTLVLHGGLFRQQPPSAKGAGAKNKRKRGTPVLLGAAATLGTLEDLAAAGRGGMDPSGLGTSRLASDVLWSDPTSAPGFQFNASRGIGMTFGPDVTERFLRDNQLRLVLRSHEGPDAREGRDDMQPMTEGWTLDHDTPCGKLMTVFSAPDYPQFVADDAERSHNKAAVAVLSAPDYATPRMVQFEADLPRPEAQPYYSLEVPGSDEEFEPTASDASGMSGLSAESGGGAAAAEEPGVVEQQQAAAGQQARQQQQQQEEQQEQQDQAKGMEVEAPAAAAPSDDGLERAAAEAGRGSSAEGQREEQPGAAAAAGAAEGGPAQALQLFGGGYAAEGPPETSSDGSKENSEGNEVSESEGLAALQGGKLGAAAPVAVPV